MNTSRLASIAIALILHAALLAWIWHQAGSPGKSGHGRRPVLSISMIATPLPAAAPAISPFLMQQDAANLPEQKPLSPPAQQDDAADKAGGFPSYYPAKELSQMPIALTELELEQPVASGQALKGRVSIRIWLNESGNIDRISATQSTLPREIENTALAAFLKMRFRPGKIKDIPVKSWVDVVIEYDDGELRPGQ